MDKYIKTVTDYPSWTQLQNGRARAEYEDGVLARWLLHGDNDPNWVQVASVKTLSILFRLFRYVLKGMSTVLILGLTAVDLLAEVLVKGLWQAKELGGEILKLLGYAAKWAGITVKSAAQFTFQIIRFILEKMLTTLQQLVAVAMANPVKGLVPIPLALGAAWMLYHYGAL